MIRDLDQLAAVVAGDIGIPESEAKRVLAASFDVIAAELSAGGTVNVAGFGKFGVHQRRPTRGVRPADGEVVEIVHPRSVRLTVARTLKEALNAEEPDADSAKDHWAGASTDDADAR